MVVDGLSRYSIVARGFVVVIALLNPLPFDRFGLSDKLLGWIFFGTFAE